MSTYWANQNRTALDCLDSIGGAIARGESPERAFRSGLSVQPVTEEFFKDYKAVYDRTVASISKTMKKEEAEQFTQTLFNRLLFIHFISKKGWTTWNGNSDYFGALWSDYRSNPAQTNFHSDRLTVLFHEGMNTPECQRDPDTEAVIGQVPYLNGGLFDRTELDLKGIHVNDEIISEIIGPDGLFSQYNFTVTEATPLDTEVAVDPEMLGKLFEETVNARHSNGAYYTPRPVVGFMCREALKGFMAGQHVPGLSEDEIATLVDGRTPEIITPQQALEIANSVAAMKVLDPACGSGAFLLGMLQEILHLNETLFRARNTSESLYKQKLDIISNNIHGVDKDGLAVSTAMLRLWLSLAVEYEGEGIPDPLPNLDMKLAVGDSISGPDPEQLDLTLHGIAKSNLLESIAEYTTAQGQRKADLKKEVEGIKQQLKDSMGDAPPAGSVEWRIEFADVMMNHGFDVVIANPPYVRQEDIGIKEEIGAKEYKNALVKQYSAAVTARSDLYCHFYARALQLLKVGGIHVFVCSNSWLDVGYGAKLQEYLLKNAHILTICESAVERQFSTADINTIITIMRKSPGSDEEETRFVSLRDEFNTALALPESRREITRTQAVLRTGGTDGNRYIGDKWGGKYLRAPDIYHHILDRKASHLIRLRDVATVRFGIKTGANKFFFLTSEVIDEWGIEPEFYEPIMTTPQESRSISVNPSELRRGLFLCQSDKSELKGTGALEYITWGESLGYHQRSSTASRPRWYDLGDRSQVFLGMNKLVDTTARTFFAPSGILFSDNFQTMSIAGEIEPVSLCTALNSTLFQLMLNAESRANFGEGVLEIQTYETANLPIVNPALLRLSDPSVFATEDWDVLTPSSSRIRVDDSVFEVLDLTKDEREAVYEGISEMILNRKRRAQSA